MNRAESDGIGSRRDQMRRKGGEETVDDGKREDGKICGAIPL